MKKFLSLALIASAAVVTAVPAVSFAEEAVASTSSAQRGAMLYSADGKRVANVYRVTEAGDAQLIYRGKMITVAANTLSDVEGKLTTSLTVADLRNIR